MFAINFRLPDDDFKALGDFQDILSACKWTGPFADWQAHLRVDHKGGRPYLQISNPRGVCNVSGQLAPWSGRKWFLSPHMTRSEVVQTLWLALRTALEHEVREAFTYRNQTIFDPHLDVDALVEFRKTYALSEREGGMEGV